MTNRDDRSHGMLLRGSVARRIPRATAVRHSGRRRRRVGRCARPRGNGGAWLALGRGAAAAGWVGDAMDLMGTRVSVELWHDDEARGRELVSQVMEDYRRIDREMSTYKPESEISLVNAHAAEKPMAISAELYSMIDRSLQLSVASHGAFDITYDSVGYLYDFRARKRPTDEQIEEHLGAVDYRHVMLDPAKSTVHFAQPGVRINLGGIAKGYTVQHAADLLRAQGVEHALLNAGGDTRVIGDRRGQPWIVGIRHPRLRERSDHPAADRRRSDLDRGRLRAVLRGRRQALSPRDQSAHRQADRRNPHGHGDRPRRHDDGRPRHRDLRARRAKRVSR